MLAQFFEIRIHRETDPAQGPGPQPHERRNVEGFENRVDADPVSIGNQAVSCNRIAVDEDQLDLRQRHAKVLNQVGDRRATTELVGKGALSSACGQVIVQLLVEPELGLAHRPIVAGVVRCGGTTVSAVTYLTGAHSGEPPVPNTVTIPR